MSDLNINPNWTFEETVNNIEALKYQVGDIIASFSSFEIKKQILFKKQLRNTIYSLKFELWKKERILECIYDYFEVEKLKKMIK